MPKITEEQFSQVLQLKLTTSWGRALAIFYNYGDNLACDVTNVLLHAADQGKVSEVLDILEKHYQSHLQFQHPEICGTVEDQLLGTNPTQAMFLRICQETLKLQPTD